MFLVYSTNPTFHKKISAAFAQSCNFTERSLHIILLNKEWNEWSRDVLTVTDILSHPKLLFDGVMWFYELIKYVHLYLLRSINLIFGVETKKSFPNVRVNITSQSVFTSVWLSSMRVSLFHDNCNHCRPVWCGCTVAGDNSRENNQEKKFVASVLYFNYISVALAKCN